MQQAKQQPILGEKPSCPRHSKNFLHFVCTTTRCKYRVLCEECVKEHLVHSPYHAADVIAINDWYKAYAKLSASFDPRENRELQYLFEELGTIFKKEKLELDKVSKLMDDSFNSAISRMTKSIMEVKEQYEKLLWTSFKSVHEDYKSLLETFEKYKKEKPKTTIFTEMKEDIASHFKKKNIKDYFDKVYSGFYDEKIHNTFFNKESAMKKMTGYKNQLKFTLKSFQAQDFTSYWNSEIDKFIGSLKQKCETDFLTTVKLHFQSPKSPKLIEEEVNQQCNIHCMGTLTDFSNLTIFSVSEDTMLTVSEEREVKVVNPLQNFRVTDEFTCKGEEDITSFSVLKYELENKANVFFLLLGGNDDCSGLEVWDTISKTRLQTYLDAHDFKISVITHLREEKTEHSITFYVATGSADGFVKVWAIEIKHLMEDKMAFECVIEPVMKVLVHDDYISCMICLKGGQKFPYGVLVSSSSDKSLVFWEWEKQFFEQHHAKMNGHMSNGACAPLNEVQILDKYTRKIPHAHSDRINAVVALSDEGNLSDLDYFATGGGDGNIIIWDIVTKKMYKTISNKKTPVFAMEYLKRDRIACSANATGMKNFHIYIWDWRKSELLVSIREHTSRVQNLILLKDNIFASVDRGKNIQVWKIDN